MQSECIAFINPSFYEGWSTINEEARSLNKHIFLSNIPGHVEQKNYGSIFLTFMTKKFSDTDSKIFLKKKHIKKITCLKKMISLKRELIMR